MYSRIQFHKAILAILIVTSFSCTHAFRLETATAATDPIPSKTEKKVFLYSDSESEEALTILKEQMETTGFFSNVKVVKTAESADPEAIRIHITKETMMLGSAKNFWISFPGVYAFLPGYLGYEYSLQNTYRLRIELPGSLPIDETIEVAKKARHSDWNRSWLVPLDWFVTLGASSLLGGFYMTRFDTDIQEQLQKEASPLVHKEFAVLLARRLNAVDETKKEVIQPEIKEEITPPVKPVEQPKQAPNESEEKKEYNEPTN